MKSKGNNQNQTRADESADSRGSSVSMHGNERKMEKNSVKVKKTRPTDIASRRNRPLPRLIRFVRRFWLWGLLVMLILWAWADPANLNMLLLGLGFVGQLLFAILFMIIQFGALFWFISRTRTVVLRPGDAKAVTFDDYWGQPALVELVKQWIKLLAERDEFIKMGGEYINGLMLFGEPGTGKTMLAKAMAGEAGVAFMSVEGSGFRGMFWGMDTLRMMTFVNKARKLAREYGACIAYIDEIDAVGASRGGVMDGQTRMAGRMPFMGGTGALTRLLYEMDGIGEPTFWERVRAKISKLLRKPPPKRNWHVLFMGSTNRPDVLDRALLRPGRFDQVIKVERPDRMGRREIIQGYISKIKHDPTQIDIDAIVADTPHATPAQIMAAITKDAVRRALFKGRDYVIQDDIDQAIQEQLVGMANPIADMDPLQLRQVAFHEAGHAVVQHYVMPDQRISRVSIIRRSSGILGFVLSVDTDEIYAQPLRRIVGRVMVSLAGHIAVKIFMGEFWTGASNDYNNARNMFRLLAMHGFFGPPVSELYTDVKELRFADERVERVWHQLEEQVERILIEHADELEVLVEALLDKKDLSNKEVLSILGKNSLQLAQEEGREVESVLAELGMSPKGLFYRRKAESDAKIELGADSEEQIKGDARG
jgi:cell division protease FtsH